MDKAKLDAAKKVNDKYGVPAIRYTDKTMGLVEHKTNTDLELLKRLKGYLNE